MKNFYCYVHRLGVMQPDVEIIASASRRTLTASLFAAMRGWRAFDVVEVYDEENRQILCVASDDRHFMN
ncbi:MAG: hypothetical protein ACK41C_00760 [Phenylobacterium sp.]|uniref:hypothetical protein n=1 Tax=Phenylobacterium sp. TaxID=1871053 RepID=UPI00391A8F47